VPTAPEVALYLDECMSTSYNKKLKDTHEPVSMKPYCDTVEEFRVKYIFPRIVAMEHREGVVALAALSEPQKQKISRQAKSCH
jgi:tRNA pseudouridine38-40 synthase